MELFTYRFLIMTLLITGDDGFRTRGGGSRLNYNYCTPCACKPPYAVLNCNDQDIKDGVVPTDHYIRAQIEEILMDRTDITSISELYWERFPKLEFVSVMKTPGLCLKTRVPSQIRIRGTVCTEQQGKYSYCAQVNFLYFQLT